METITQENETITQAIGNAVYQMDAESFFVHATRALLFVKNAKTTAFQSVLIAPNGDLVATDGPILYKGKLKVASDAPVLEKRLLIKANRLVEFLVVIKADKSKHFNSVFYDPGTKTLTYKNYNGSSSTIETVEHPYPNYQDVFIPDGPKPDRSVQFSADAFGTICKAGKGEDIVLDLHPPGHPSYVSILGEHPAECVIMPLEK